MRNAGLVVSAFALACLGLPLTLHAQFQEPTKEELQMTSDPAAPGAAAVYLYREETTDDQLHFHSIYERIKVLTEKGKELATIRVPYERGNFQVTDIRGRTIHSDGTVIPLTAKPEDLTDVKTKGFQVNTMVFTLPSVEVGSILEYRLQIRYDDNSASSPTWEVQQPYFVHKAHYFFNPSNRWLVNGRGELLNRIMYQSHTGDYKIVMDQKGRYTLDVANVPPLPDDDWMPPLNSVRWRTAFYYTQYASGAEFWQKEGKRWDKEAKEFAGAGKGIQAAAAQIVAPTDTEEQKARKLYDAVMKLDNTSFTREKSEAERKKEKIKEIKKAEDVWNEKSGSANDLALLYVALARAAGLHAWPMQVTDRNEAIFDPTYLSLSQLDDYIVIVQIGQKEVFLDPGQKMCPFGLLAWKHTFSGGLRDSAQGPGYTVTPGAQYTQNLMERVADLTVSADGSLTGSARFILSGQEALHWRQLTLRNDESEVKKQFNEMLRRQVPDGVQAELDHFLGLENYDSDLMAMVKISGNVGSATGKHFFLPGEFFESRATHPFVSEPARTIPVDVKYPRLESDDVTWHLPQGYAVESTPPADNVSWPSHALLKVTATNGPAGLDITRKLAYNFTLVESKDYGSLHDFYQKVATADQQQLVLSRTAVVAKSN